ncbi:MAG: molybdenum cofactor biosynthesis protein MoaE [Candidatus Korarchaeum sp.]|nr:molybdenum cofactor biosynthesis protein MoaE [Candidatus Korarchaeum sp.]MDW8035942.1 molybdenum cofactor biosynthesis protein MoaE [Candidatus Korarchaeum sp.]
MVSLRVFGWLSDLLGFKNSELEFEGSLKELLNSLRGELEEMVREGRVQVALNHELIRDLSVKVSRSDVVAIFPSFSGGFGRAGVLMGRIDAEEFLKEATDGSVGAVVLFLGVVRRDSEEGEVERIFYDCYPEVAERELTKIREEAVREFGLKDAILLHRVGDVPVGEVALLVVTKSAHRREAFEAAMWIVDEVKRRAAIWKKEIFSDGRSRWVSQ